MIAVCITTYNHETFIAQAIESVQVQVCDELLRIYIGDDASTDGTRQICERFAAQDKRIVYVHRPKNMGLVANTIDLYHRIVADGCEYIAMLDGDDYWIDTHKLQTQVDYLRAHPECGLVHTASYDEEDGKRIDRETAVKPTGDIRTRYDLSGALHTNSSVMFRTELLKQVDVDELDKQHFPVLDYPLYGLFSQCTEFGYIPVYTAVQRMHVSVSHPVRFGTYMRYKKERIRMWKWLDKEGNGNFHFKAYRAFLWYIWQFFYFLFAYIKKKLYLCSRF